ncbi:class I SAM-dependent methyltransferase [Patescibacteria group bacterium]|nr:class I SAM-dependent methyltransferase [Patescibacteria group bacterium]MCL5409262.1 class I SAM-dependent methyltransferase [Patescibacteria group bacterium]
MTTSIKIKTLTLQTQDFQKIFSRDISSYVAKKIKQYRLRYQLMSLPERDHFVRRMVDVLLDPTITRAGKHRVNQWEEGWDENMQALQKTQQLDAIIPKYFGKYPVIRWQGQLIKPLSTNFEYNSLRIIVDWLFDKYLRKCDYIYEFGCGTGYHLLQAREVNKEATIVGLDWVKSSQNIIMLLAKLTKDTQLFGHRFDFFNPDYEYKLAHNSVAYTIAALEQTGASYKKFVRYLIKNKPKYVINVEPIAEMLDEKVLLDYLSIRYFQKRNYLSGFLNYLQLLEKQGKVKIHLIKRSYIGSLFIEGYSIVVWSPL